jgi:hypothetical protein
MLEAHGLGTKSNLYKANYVRWDLSRDNGVKEVTDPYFNKDDFETHWDILFSFYFYNILLFIFYISELFDYSQILEEQKTTQS